MQMATIDIQRWICAPGTHYIYMTWGPEAVWIIKFDTLHMNGTRN